MAIREKLSSIPKLGDPSWPARAKPVREFLAKPRTWAEIDVWRKQNRLGQFCFRNALAYLEIKGKVTSRYVGGVLVWVQVGVSVPRSVQRPSPEKEGPHRTDDEALLQQLLPEPEGSDTEEDHLEEAAVRVG